MDFLVYPAAFLLLLGVLVTIHEFGHYLVARLSGVQVLKFSVGFGRPLWSRVDGRGTEFALAAIPLGGYVKMLDDRDPEQHALRTPGSVAYMDLHPRWRIAIALAGPLANFLLAIVVYGFLQFIGDFQPVPMTKPAATESAVAQSGLSGPAAIYKVDGVDTQDWEQVGLALTSRLGETGAIELEVLELESGQRKTLDVPIEDWHAGVGDPDVIRSLGLNPSMLALIGQVVEDTPAAAAGLQANDWIVSAAGEEIADWQQLVGVIQAHAAQSIELVYVRGGVRLVTTVTPGSRTIEEQDGQTRDVGFLGVGPATQFLSVSLLSALPAGLQETWSKTGLVVSLLQKMVVGQVSVKNLSGPLTIAQVAGDSAQYGWRYFLGLMGFLSISLGVLNLLPIPILDGGHVLFSSAEWALGKPVPEQVQIWGVQIGLVLVAGMIVLATYNDILRFFVNG